MSEYRLQNASKGIIGPVKLETVRDLAEGGVIQSDVLVSRDNGPFLPISAFSELVDAVSDRIAAAPPPTYSGDVGVLTFFKIFYRLYEMRSTGLLSVRDGTLRKDVYLEDGQPVFVTSSTYRERLGEFLLRQGVLEPEALRAAVETMQQTRRPLGDILVESGILTRQQLVVQLREQQISRLVDLCCWERGRYAFHDGMRYEGHRIDIQLETPELVLRAARQMPEKTVLLRLGAHLHQIAEPAPSRLASRCAALFEPDEATVLQRLDGNATAVQLVTADGGRRRRAALTVLYLMWEIGGITFRSRP